MFVQIWITSVLCVVALAAPQMSLGASRPAVVTVGKYFNMLGKRVQALRATPTAPTCILQNANLPVASPVQLPPPSNGLVLRHIAIGRGTQNYTCMQNNETAVPVSAGAIATLYNASCVAATDPYLLSTFPNVALQVNPAGQGAMLPTNLAISGNHFFSNSTTADFNLKTATTDLGYAPCQKNNSVAAPAGASVGQGDMGFGAVAWLKLLTRVSATGGLEEVYRVNTAGGNPPPTCKDMPATFEVQYAAEYWFYGSTQNTEKKTQ